jgi:hypothetical protein
MKTHTELRWRSDGMPVLIKVVCCGDEDEAQPKTEVKNNG